MNCVFFMLSMRRLQSISIFGLLLTGDWVKVNARLKLRRRSGGLNSGVSRITIAFYAQGQLRCPNRAAAACSVSGRQYCPGSQIFANIDICIRASRHLPVRNSKSAQSRFDSPAQPHAWGYLLEVMPHRHCNTALFAASWYTSSISMGQGVPLNGAGGQEAIMSISNISRSCS